MDVLIRLPQALAVDAAGQCEFIVDLQPGATLGDLLSLVQAEHPALGRRLCDETGAIRRFVNVYIDNDESRTLRGLATTIAAGSVILIAGSVAGG